MEPGILPAGTGLGAFRLREQGSGCRPWDSAGAAAAQAAGPLDSGSALRTNLSGLVTVANAAPENLVHFLYEEAMDGLANGDSGPGFNRVSYRALAEGAGYAATYQFEALEDLLIGLEEAMGGPGPTFVSLSVAPSWRPSTPAARPMAESAAVVKQGLERPTEP